MANEQHLQLLQQGTKTWNSWRDANPSERPDLSSAALCGMQLVDANLRDTNLARANLDRTNLMCADLTRADMTGASLSHADFGYANLTQACLKDVVAPSSNFTGASLSRASFSGASLRGAFFGDDALPHIKTVCDFVNFYAADLTGAVFFRAFCEFSDFTHATLVETSFQASHLEASRFLRGEWTGAQFVECWVFGVAIWGMRGLPTVQSGLVVAAGDEPLVEVDDLETAQLVYLLLNNEKLRSVFDAIGNKGVLLLGRFTPERKLVLDKIRDKLRSLGFLPIVFDFEKSTGRDFTETVRTLAGLSRFIIADITSPKSAPLELQATIPDYMVPLVPIIEDGEQPFSMFVDLQQKYRDWVLELLVYRSVDGLMNVFERAVVEPAISMANSLVTRRAESVRKRHVDDYR